MSDDEYTLTIGDLARACGRSVHTIRYYERQGLIPYVVRNGAGHRRYRQDHIGWMLFLDRLRLSGMSLEAAKKYARLVRSGRDNIEERRQLLREHLTDIEARRRALDACADIVRAKLDFYRRLATDPDAVWSFPES